jgi:hypothetical protein
MTRRSLFGLFPFGALAQTKVDSAQISIPLLQTWVYSEAYPIGASAPTTITLAKPLVPGTELLYRNGLRQTRGVDYTVSTNVITWTASTLEVGDNVLVDYRTA